MLSHNFFLSIFPGTSSMWRRVTRRASAATATCRLTRPTTIWRTGAPSSSCACAPTSLMASSSSARAASSSHSASSTDICTTGERPSSRQTKDDMSAIIAKSATTCPSVSYVSINDVMLTSLQIVISRTTCCITLQIVKSTTTC